MPLGNHTSQFFANVYLGELDKFVKHELKAKYYIRYVDDFVILSNSKKELEDYKSKIDNFLKRRLNLTLHPDKSKVLLLERGISFLGFRIFYYHKIPRKANIRKFENKLEELKILYKENQLNREEIVECLEGWMAYARHGNTYRYRRELLRNFNKNFRIRDKSQIIRSAKITNFFRKVHASKIEFSSQKTLLLLKKGLSIKEIAEIRRFKEGTIWEHIANLIEHGQLQIWKIMPKRKIARILQKIKHSAEPLKEVKERGKSADYNEINSVRAYLKMKENIKRKNIREAKKEALQASSFKE